MLVNVELYNGGKLSETWWGLPYYVALGKCRQLNQNSPVKFTFRIKDNFDHRTIKEYRP